jgi:hypothetical protein
MEEAEREREYWSAVQVFTYEIEKNERSIEEWKKTLGFSASVEGILPSNSGYYAGLIKDAESRITHLWQRIMELDSRQSDED